MSAMRISELIERLRECHELYGDCPVYVEDRVSGWAVDAEDAEYLYGLGGVALTFEAGWDE